MRTWEPPYPHDQHMARLICGDPIAQSKQWLFEFLDELNSRCSGKTISVTFDELLNAAASHQYPFVHQWESLIRGKAFGNIYAGKQFWENFQIYTGLKIPPDNQLDFLGTTEDGY